jgi:hypothetical protein
MKIKLFLIKNKTIKKTRYFTNIKLNRLMNLHDCREQAPLFLVIICHSRDITTDCRGQF